MKKFKKEYYIPSKDMEAKLKELKLEFDIIGSIMLSFGWGSGYIVEFDYKKH